MGKGKIVIYFVIVFMLVLIIFLISNYVDKVNDGTLYRIIKNYNNTDIILRENNACKRFNAIRDNKGVKGFVCNYNEYIEIK